MMPLIDIMDSGTKIRIWVGRWIDVLVEEDRRLEGWMFQREGGERICIQYLEEVFYEALRELQVREVGLIPEGVDNGENMSLRRALKRG